MANYSFNQCIRNIYIYIYIYRERERYNLHPLIRNPPHPPPL